MAGRVLIVSTWFSIAIRLEAVLSAASLEVAIATRAEDCLALCESDAVDVIVLDAVPPAAGTEDLCRALKGNPKSARAALLVMTLDEDPLCRLRAVDAGADECLLFPIDEVSLLTRVRSLLELRSLADQAHRSASVPDRPYAGHVAAPQLPLRVLLLDPEDRSRERLAHALAPEFLVSATAGIAEAGFAIAEGLFDIAAVSREWRDHDGLWLCRHMRIAARSHALQVLLIVDRQDLRAREFEECGADDILRRPIDRNEALARFRVAARKHRLLTGSRPASGFGRHGRSPLQSGSRRETPDRFAA
jgi:two-component system, cell cycle response regulator